jgi:hypothetical protein
MLCVGVEPFCYLLRQWYATSSSSGSTFLERITLWVFHVWGYDSAAKHLPWF